MKKLIIIIIILAAGYYLFKSSGFFGSPLEKLAKKVKQMDIVSCELQWLIQQKGKQSFTSLYKGSDLAVINAIKKSMDNITPYTTSGGFNYIWLKPLGILKLKSAGAEEQRIDITYGCFFAGANRVDTAAFYSPELSNIIKKIFDSTSKEYNLLTTEDLFSVLSKGGALKPLSPPQVRQIFVERIKQKSGR